MRTRTIARAISVLATGLAAGVLLGHRMGVSMAMPQLTPSGFVQLQQIIHVYFARMMPVLIFASIGATAAWAFLLRGRRTAEFRLASVAAVAMASVLAMTLAVNYPINAQLMTWSVENPPSNLSELWRPWETVHSIRTVIAVGAFACQAIAMARAASRVEQAGV